MSSKRRTLPLARVTEVTSIAGGASEDGNVSTTPLTHESVSQPESSTPFLRDRISEEPIGRWDNRCPFTRYLGFQQHMVCDRRDGHRGLHQGRMFYGIGHGANASIVGWLRVRT